MNNQNQTPALTGGIPLLTDPAPEHLLFERSPAESWAFPRTHLTYLEADGLAHSLRVGFSLYTVIVTAGSALQGALLMEAIATGMCSACVVSTGPAADRQFELNELPHPTEANGQLILHAVCVRQISLEDEPDPKD